MRSDNDFYETAPWQADALVDHLPEFFSFQHPFVLCPCVGDGSLMRRLKEWHPGAMFITNDIDPAREADTHMDATTPEFWAQTRDRWWHINFIIENFPFNVEHLIVPQAYEAVRDVLVAMARVSYAEPTRDRGPWLSDHPYQRRITLERHSFTGNGKTDSATTDWLVWSKRPIAGPFGVSAFGYRDGSAQHRRSLLRAMGQPDRSVALDPVLLNGTEVSTRVEDSDPVSLSRLPTEGR